MTHPWPLTACLAADSLLDHPNLPWIAGALVIVFLLGAIVIAWADRWRKAADEVESPMSLMTAFRQAHERGEMSDEEYKRVRAKLAPKLRGDQPPRPQPPTPPPADAAD